MKADVIHNLVDISGVLKKEFEKSHGNYSKALVTVHTNDRIDTLPVIWENAREIEAGTPVSIMGEIRRYGKLENDYKQFILIREIEILPEVKYENWIYLSGTLREFINSTDFSIEVKRASYERVTDYISCYAYRSNRKELCKIPKGEKIVITGKVRARTFLKKTAENPKGEERKIVEVEIEAII